MLFLSWPKRELKNGFAPHFTLLVTKSRADDHHPCTMSHLHRLRFSSSNSNCKLVGEYSNLKLVQTFPHIHKKQCNVPLEMKVEPAFMSHFRKTKNKMESYLNYLLEYFYSVDLSCFGL